MTSHDVIYRIRKVLNIKKVGHAGTLDPLAQGVLPVGVGNATRLLDYLPNEKEYIAEMKFGYISDTFDSEGKISKYSELQADEETLKNAVMSFVGDITQKPPIYSAVKVNGKKLYDYARKGISAEIPERIIHVDKIDLLSLNEEENTAKILVRCSKGTYIRSIINDLGQKLQIGAYMTDLTRTLSGGMRIENSVNIDDITPEFIISPNSVLNFPETELSVSEYQRVKNGNPVNINEKDGFVFLKYNKSIVSLADIVNGVAYSKKVFSS